MLNLYASIYKMENAKQMILLLYYLIYATL